MDTPALTALRLESSTAHATHAVRLALPEQAARILSQTSVESVVLTTEPQTNQPVIVVQSAGQRVTLPVPLTAAVMRVLEVNPQIPMQVQISEHEEVMLTALVQRPEPTMVVLRGVLAASSQANQISVNQVISTPLPQALSALTQVTHEQVNGALSNQGPLPTGSGAPSGVKSQAWEPMHVARSVAESIQSVGGMAKPVFIPDISQAIPRPMSPDAMPAQVPIKQPIADELGLKAGQVVQALVASSKGQQHMQFGNQQVPLPPGMQLPQGDVFMRVIQTPQGLALAPQLANNQPQAAQSVAASGLSAALAAVIAKPSVRPTTQSLFAVDSLETQLISAGLSKDAQFLQANRLSSQQLSGQHIAAAVKFGGLMNEKAIAEGVGFQAGMLKPWLRQLLRLLPHQSELSFKLADLIGELESFQLESLPQSGTRDHGLSALLLFRDQPPVEMTFERHESENEDDQQPLWVVNLHTSLEALGEVWLRSSFSGSSVDVMFWASQPATAHLAKGARLDLEEGLSEHGLTVNTLQIFDVPRPGHEHLSPNGLPHTDVSA